MTDYTLRNTNRDVYPESAAFEDFWDTFVVPNFDETKGDHIVHQAIVSTLFSVMRSNLGEYEHGSADVEDVFEGIGEFNVDAEEEDAQSKNWRILLRMYSAVCGDILLSLQAHLRD